MSEPQPPAAAVATAAAHEEKKKDAEDEEEEADFEEGDEEEDDEDEEDEEDRPPSPKVLPSRSTRGRRQHVPEGERPPQEPLEVDYDPWAGTPWAGAGRPPTIPGPESGGA